MEDPSLLTETDRCKYGTSSHRAPTRSVFVKRSLQNFEELFKNILFSEQLLSFPVGIMDSELESVTLFWVVFLICSEVDDLRTHLKVNAL